MPSCFTVVLAGDYGYIRQIETTIKSLLCHHSNVKIYVINQDIPQDWFLMVNQAIVTLGSQVVDLKFYSSFLAKELPTFDHINSMTYARFFIPELIDEERLIYLDSDMIVDGDLTDLFELDLAPTDYLAAVPDILVDEYNAGLLVINNKAWQEQGVFEGLMEETQKRLEWYESASQAEKQMFNADQTILNTVLKAHIRPLDMTYNYQIGQDFLASIRGDVAYANKIASVVDPKIIHYVTYDKPWNFMSSSRLRERWWHYYQMSFHEIANYWKFQNRLSLQKSVQYGTHSALVVTNSENLEQIVCLVENMPNLMFNIAAYTNMGTRLLQLMTYPNVKLYAKVTGFNLDFLIEHCSLYLDINHGIKFSDILDAVCAKRCPVFAFDNTCQTSHGQKVFSHTEPLDMIQSIYDTLDFNRK